MPRVLTDIASSSWEHPADRAALNALRRLPAFDEVLRKLFGLFGEKPVRLAFQANAVRASPTQFARVHHLYEEAAEVLNAPGVYPVYISQSPAVNAGAYGMEKPFIIVNSGTLHLLDDDELRFVLAHEIGHIMSGHVLYTTMMMILLQLGEQGFPIVGMVARAILYALLEWYRKAELSADRAGALAVQDPEVGMRVMMKLAGGGSMKDTDLPEFLRQAEEYRSGGDLADQVFKVLNLLGADHPFPVLRVAELRDWYQSGDYDRILRGEYRRRGETESGYREDLAAAARSYAENARSTLDTATEAARRMMDSFRR
ncbi:MAG: M48 family metallopeptidase [Gemmatimonadota bacterium]|jgi:Zn-dependent protease with chaperone function|nr:M48 family metallopeptidase [Gemmatimonadota bacterium]